MAQENPDTKKSDTDEPLGDTGLRALQAEREENRRLRKQREELQAKLDASETAQLSKEEQLQRKLQEAQGRVKELETEKELTTLREKIAETTGVPVKLLAGVGSDESSIKSFAETLKTHLAETTAPRAPEPNRNLDKDQGDTGNVSDDALSVLGFE